MRNGFRSLSRAGIALALTPLLLPLSGSFWPAADSEDGPSRRTAAAATAPAVPGELLVRFRPTASAAERSALRRQVGADLERTLAVQGLQQLQLGRAASVDEARRELEEDGDVLYAEPNYIRWAGAIPSDSGFGSLWGLRNTEQQVDGQRGTFDADIDATEAWDYTTGSASVSVAVVDSGLADDHPDLAPNRWPNPGEAGAKATNGADDDKNGYKDDWRGWDFVDGDNAPLDPHGHGTHVAGTIGARGGDAHGVAGVSWASKLMPLRVLDANGSGTVSNLVNGYKYASSKGARVVNASLGSASYSRAESDAIKAAPGTLFVAAAGNDGSNNDNPATPQYPCNHTAANIICVAASDQDDALASFSNHGSSSVDLAAPGTRILSAQPGNGYAFLHGTSMAAPHVAGVAALGWASSPSASVAEIKQRILASVDSKPSLVATTAAAGRLNAVRALTGGQASLFVEPKPSPPVGPDASPPALSVSVASRHRLARGLKRGLQLRVGCSEPCHVRLRLVLDGRTAKARRLSRGRAVVVGGGSASLGAAGTAPARVTFTAKARRALARARSARLKLVTEASDNAGNSSARTSRILLRR